MFSTWDVGTGTFRGGSREEARKSSRSTHRPRSSTGPSLEKSREPLGIEYRVADAARLEFLRAGTLDLVTCHMALMDIEHADSAIGEVGRVLRTGGRFVAILSHPCFDQGPSSTWLIERLFRATKVWRKIERYREPFADEIPWEIAPGQIVTTTGYHRPLSWYARVLRGAGLLIRSLEEAWP